MLPILQKGRTTVECEHGDSWKRKQ